jgi:hypothetical protein
VEARRSPTVLVAAIRPQKSEASRKTRKRISTGFSVFARGAARRWAKLSFAKNIFVASDQQMGFAPK